MVTRVTLHNINRQKEKGAGVGATIEILRSGEVIPFLKAVIKPSNDFKIPEDCPCCGTPLIESGEGLSCPNGLDCPEQSMQSITHFFKTLGTANGFGIEAVRKFHEAGIHSVSEVYKNNAASFRAIGFGPKTSINMENALKNTAIEKVDDWRFLAAFGCRYLGRGASKLLLKYIPMETFDTYHRNIQDCGGYDAPSAQGWVDHLTSRIQRIPNFGSTTAPSIACDLMAEWEVIQDVRNKYMALYRTPLNPAFYVETIDLDGLDKTLETFAILAGEQGSAGSPDINDNMEDRDDDEESDDTERLEARNELLKVRNQLMLTNTGRVQAMHAWLTEQSIGSLTMTQWVESARTVEDWMSAWSVLIPKSSWVGTENRPAKPQAIYADHTDHVATERVVHETTDTGTIWDPEFYADLFSLETDTVANTPDVSRCGADKPENIQHVNESRVENGVAGPTHDNVAFSFSTEQFLSGMFNELKRMPKDLFLCIEEK
jgi:hypothetical protein